MPPSPSFPPIYLLPTHLETERLHELEEQIPSLTYDPREADVIIGNISKPERALFELRRRSINFRPPARRERINPAPDIKKRNTSHTRTQGKDRTLKVAKLKWFTDSLARGDVLPLDDYLILEVNLDTEEGPPQSPEQATGTLADTKRPPLLRQTTTEETAVPPVPDFLNTPYSCQRPSPVDSPNAPFVDELKKIRKVRILMGDAVGIRAYSTSIASVAAYPYPLQSQLEIARLPGCGRKIAELYQEWKRTGETKEGGKIDTDPRLAVLALFYDIWGVGDVTAREFYSKGWRDLDDVVEFGWNSLTRVQQIGVKYYDDLKLGIPRREVEFIANTILSHARAIDPGFEMTIVGGYRRGKQASGDVDLVLSHRDEALTQFFVGRLVMALEESDFISHTLTLSNRNSERGQQPLVWKGVSGQGSGFDTLDKAMLVWQTPAGLGPGEESTRKGAPRPRRRVDIIVSPWKTVGCAIIGWTGGTTFQRDLRRYCKVEKRLKFDSSGIRSRTDGSWVDFEAGALGKSPDMLTSEKRVFSGLELEWRPPEERCTG